MVIEGRWVKVNGRWPVWMPEHRAKRPHWEEEGWEVSRLDHMSGRLEPGMVLYDVGSEEGELSALFASWGARLILFEPNCRVWPNTRLIWDQNDLESPLCYEGFVADVTDPPDQLYVGSWPECAYGEVVGDHAFEQFHYGSSIPMTRLDDFVSASQVLPDAVTVDVEGSELFVLTGMSGLETKPLVWCSIHPREMESLYGHSVDGILDLMDFLGYRYEYLGKDHESHFFFEPR